MSVCLLSRNRTERTSGHDDDNDDDNDDDDGDDGLRRRMTHDVCHRRAFGQQTDMNLRAIYDALHNLALPNPWVARHLDMYYILERFST